MNVTMNITMKMKELLLHAILRNITMVNLKEIRYKRVYHEQVNLQGASLYKVLTHTDFSTTYYYLD